MMMISPSEILTVSTLSLLGSTPESKELIWKMLRQNLGLILLDFLEDHPTAPGVKISRETQKDYYDPDTEIFRLSAEVTL